MNRDFTVIRILILWKNSQIVPGNVLELFGKSDIQIYLFKTYGIIFQMSKVRFVWPCAMGLNLFIGVKDFSLQEICMTVTWYFLRRNWTLKQSGRRSIKSYFYRKWIYYLNIFIYKDLHIGGIHLVFIHAYV